MSMAKLSAFTQKSGKTASQNKIQQTSLADFIPYASFLDDRTIITKNGELLQTFKIAATVDGLPTENAAQPSHLLRDVIRDALGAALHSDDFSVWLHVMRNKIPLPPLSSPAEPFAKKLQNDWLKKQRTKYAYQNECYLTILVGGKPVKLLSAEDIKLVSIPKKNITSQQEYREVAQKKLQHAANLFTQHAAKYFTVHPLLVVPRTSETGEDVYYSEQMELFQRIVNLTEQPMPVRKTDLSMQLANHEVIFGFDAMETKLHRHKRFASIVSLKHMQMLPPRTLDRFLQMPAEMIITQTFNFVPASVAREETKDIRHILKQSKDGYIAQQSGFIDLLQADAQKSTDFAEQQTTIMLMTDHYPELDGLTTELQTIIATIGLISVREDIKLEEVFWSQLPGNFEFIRRKHVIAAKHAFSLARLNYYQVGTFSSRWGEPITIFPTDTNTPYLFHFHHQQGGHTAIIDYNSFPDALSFRLIHFLIAAASKQAPRIVMFDRFGSGRIFTDHMQGTYLQASHVQNSLRLNPFEMPLNTQNQNFLSAWLALALDVEKHDADSRDAIRACVAKSWEGNNSKQGFAQLIACMQSINPSLASRLQALTSRPVFQHVFGSGQDNFDFDHTLTSVNIHKDCFDEQSHALIFALLLHRCILALDGKPTLIVVKEAWDLLEHPFFATRLTSLAQMLTEKNAVLLLSNRNVDKLSSSAITRDIIACAATRLFIPDDIAGDTCADFVGISKAEDDMLLKMDRQKGDLMIVHGKETVPTRLKIEDAQAQAILVGDTKTLQGMRSG